MDVPRSGDVGFASQSDHTDGQIAQRCHDLGRGAGAFQSAHLGQVGPVAIAREQVGGPQSPLFDATAMLVNLHRLGRFRFPFPDGRDVPQSRQ